MNRISQHLAAVGLAPAPIAPLKGEAHFRIARYTPAEVKPDWKPKHVEDSIVELDYKQVRYGHRHRDLAAALCEVRTFNAGMITAARPLRWATIAWIDTGPVKLAEHFARLVLPLRYIARDILAPTDWKPRTLLDAPTWPWLDETAPLRVRRFSNLDTAARHAAKKNRRYGQGKRKDWNRWWIVLAIHAEPSQATCYMEGADGKGIAALHSVRRFHVVNPSWPLSPAVLAGIGGAL